MTTITLPRAVVEQALEALELGDEWHPSTLEAITALRAALAQQAEPVKFWPLAPLTGYYDVGGRRVWLEKDDPFPVPAPPQRKPLPNHDQHCVDVPGYGLMAVRLVRAVERAHGIGEGA